MLLAAQQVKSRIHRLVFTAHDAWVPSRASRFCEASSGWFSCYFSLCSASPCHRGDEQLYRYSSGQQHAARPEPVGKKLSCRPNSKASHGIGFRISYQPNNERVRSCQSHSTALASISATSPGFRRRNLAPVRRRTPPAPRGRRTTCRS